MPPPDRKPRILLVDDDERILGSLRIALKRSYDVVCCASALEGLREVENRTPDVIVSDIKMPEHDGFWFFNELKKSASRVPFIFNSAYQDVMSQTDVTKGLRPFGYLPKGGSLAEFTAMVERALRRGPHGT